MNYPEYAEIDGKRFQINTDFRVAIECNEIAQDTSINDFERSLAIIYKLFGREGLDDSEHHQELLEKGLLFLACGKPLEKNNHEEPNMDFVEDMDYIEASFMSDYRIDLSEQKMHWWKFNKLIDGLSNSELGNCCILNRIRNIRTHDMKDIKDPKERERWMKAKEQVALKKNKKEIKLTQDQEESMESLNKLLGI
jgi:hypothetical protein